MAWALFASSAPLTSLPALALTLPTLYGGSNGLLYFDTEPLDTPFRIATPEQVVSQTPLTDTAEVVNAPGTEVGINYRLREKSLKGEIMEASDSPGLGSVLFTVGDGSVNPAIDELVRTLPIGKLRRAVVPASFELLRREQVAYYDPWPVVSYVELSIRRRTQSTPIFRCSSVDGSSMCVKGASRGSKYGKDTDLLPKID